MMNEEKKEAARQRMKQLHAEGRLDRDLPAKPGTSRWIREQLCRICESEKTSDELKYKILDSMIVMNSPNYKGRKSLGKIKPPKKAPQPFTQPNITPGLASRMAAYEMKPS